jgi:nitroreductase
MKKALLLIAAFIGFTRLNPFSPAAADNDNPALANLTGNFAIRNFAPGGISRADLEKILLAGSRAPSANNKQPWHFTVVQNQDLAKQIVSNIVEGNVLIIISAAGDGKTNGPAILDCGLATQSIYLAAQALGLGSRIYTGPINTINIRLKAGLDLPGGYNAIALVRIGKLPAGTDAVSGASPRKELNAMVSYK